MSHRACLFTVVLSLAAAGIAPSAAAPPACPVQITVEPFCATWGAAGTPFAVGANCRVADVDGFPRQYIVYVPAVAPRGGGLPVVTMLHGSSGDGPQFLRISGWREKADAEGIVAIFPTALPAYTTDPTDDTPDRCTTKWHQYGLASTVSADVKPVLVGPSGPLLGYPPSAPWPADDPAFVRAMLDDVQALLPVDPRRLYVSGFSNGAAFAARVALEVSDRIAAVGIVGGGLAQAGAGPARRHLPARAVLGACDAKAAATYGVALDEVACVAGRDPGLPRQHDQLEALAPLFGLSIDNLLQAFALQASPSVDATTPAVTTRSWRRPQRGNSDGNELHHAILARVTHQYPRCNAGGCNNPLGFNSADEFWPFFERHRKPLVPDR